MVMNMSDKDCLKFDVYEYLKYCKEKKVVRGVGVITDKQFLFYSQLLRGDCRIHPEIIAYLECEIHPDSSRRDMNALRDNNVYLMVFGHGRFQICLPENGQLSKNQLNFIIDMLKQIRQYNSEQMPENEKVKLEVFNSIIDGIYQENISELEEKLEGVVTKYVRIESEKIIGSTLEQGDILSNLLYHTSLDDCSSILTLKRGLANCKRYALDKYYKVFFCSFFPNYSSVVCLIEIIDQLGIPEDTKLESVTFENVEIILINVIKRYLNEFSTDNRSVISRITDDMSAEEIINHFVSLGFSINLGGNTVPSRRVLS